MQADDLYRPEHRLVFQAILCLHAKGNPIDYLAVEEELRKSGDFGKIDHLYLLGLIDATFTNARAEYHARIIKEKANLRKIIELGEKSPADISFFTQQYFNNITRAAAPSKKKLPSQIFFCQQF